MNFICEPALQEYMQKKKRAAILVEEITSSNSDFEITELHIPSCHPERNFSLQYFFQKLCHFTQRRKSHLSLPSGKHLRFFLIRRELFQFLLQGIQFFFDPPHIKIPGDCAKLPLHIRITIQICQDRMIQVLIGCLPLLT